MTGEVQAASTSASGTVGIDGEGAGVDLTGERGQLFDDAAGGDRALPAAHDLQVGGAQGRRGEGDLGAGDRTDLDRAQTASTPGTSGNPPSLV